jgi:hypothetical protein
MKRLLGMVVATGALIGLAACDGTSLPTEVPAARAAIGAEMVPEFRKHRGGRISKRRGRPVEAGQSVSAVIDHNGGELIVGRHRLMVPRNALNRETMLEMTIVDSDLTEFRLSATSVTTSARKGGRRGTVEFALGAENDVGSRGVLRRVELELAFDQAVGADDREQFMIVWVVNPDAPEAEQTLEAMPSRWDKRGLRVTGQLQHVSRYAVGSNRGEDPGMS